MTKFKNIEYQIKTKKTSNGYDFYIDYKDGGHGEIWTAIEPLGFTQKGDKFIQNYCINLCEFQPHNWQAPKTKFDKTRQRKGLGQHLLKQITKIILKKEKRPINHIITYPISKEMKKFTKKNKWKQMKNTNLHYITIKQILKTTKGGK